MVWPLLLAPFRTLSLPRGLPSFLTLLLSCLSLLLLLGRLLLPPCIRFICTLLPTSFLLLASLLHHLPTIRPLLALLLTLLWGLAPLPASAHLLSFGPLPFLPLRSGSLLTLLLAFLPLRLLSLDLLPLLALWLLSLGLLLATSPVSSAATVTAAFALTEQITVGTDERNEPQCGYRG